ncbi:ribosome biogenesis protein NOP53 [Ascoidea rubescens DSM 1968]|uniref:Ribosome biogenesis protein NOP53 n=1 Tax=Ascoidea rubescens DSM 1968 TaxID=1344418 RepID=A0A1D2VI66_9ASCO|nr:Nop53-domain-containing protein [Ascoidea rubescens DSM 1968]ODV61177.1 Nop53-domain-containing protein [Ascoidea rubescens DSM 1968]
MPFNNKKLIQLFNLFINSINRASMDELKKELSLGLKRSQMKIDKLKLKLQDIQSKRLCFQSPPNKLYSCFKRFFKDYRFAKVLVKKLNYGFSLTRQFSLTSGVGSLFSKHYMRSIICPNISSVYCGNTIENKLNHKLKFEPKSLVLATTPNNCNEMIDIVDKIQKQFNDLSVFLVTVDSIGNKFKIRNGISELWLEEDIEIEKSELLHSGIPTDVDSGVIEEINYNRNEIKWKSIENYYKIEIPILMNEKSRFVKNLNIQSYLSNTLFNNGEIVTMFYMLSPKKIEQVEEKQKNNSNKFLSYLSIKLPVLRPKAINNKLIYHFKLLEEIPINYRMVITNCKNNLLKEINNEAASLFLQNNETIKKIQTKEFRIFATVVRKNNKIGEENNLKVFDERYEVIAGGGEWGDKANILVLSPEAELEEGDELKFWMLDPKRIEEYEKERESGSLKVHEGVNLENTGFVIWTNAIEMEVGRPSQRSQSSRKTKRSWRKNIDIDDIERDLEEKREAIRKYGIEDIEKLPSSELFEIDTVGSSDILRKKKIEIKTLKADEILNKRSKLPTLVHPKKINNKIQGVDKKEAFKLMKLAGKVQGVTRTQAILEEVHSKKKNGKRNNKLDLYDAWNDSEKTVKKSKMINDIYKENRSLTSYTKAKVIPETLKKAPIQIREIEDIPMGGKSYNPSLEDWKSLIIKEYEKEKFIEDRKLQIESKNHRIQKLILEIEKKEKEDDEVDSDDDVDEKEEDNNGLGLSLNKPVVRKQKTKAKRNKEKKHQERIQLENEVKLLKKQITELQDLNVIKKKVEKESAEKEKLLNTKKIEKNSKIQKRKLGTKYNPINPQLEVKLSDELTDSLRKLRPEGNLFYDQMRIMQSKGKVEARVPVVKKRRYAQKVTEKWTFKDFK